MTQYRIPIYKLSLIRDSSVTVTQTDVTKMARGRMTPQHLTTIRKCLAWSQARLARELGVSPATVCRWESGKIRIPLSMARLIGLVSGALPPHTPASSAATRPVDPGSGTAHVTGPRPPRSTPGS